MKALQKAIIAALACGASLGVSSSAIAAGSAMYEVTITNLTRGQAFTPVLVASHRGDAEVFELGTAASPELAAMAEGGDTSGVKASIEANARKVDTAMVDGLIMPGHSATVYVSARGANRISLGSMLIPTNDSFIALDSVKAPKHRHQSVVYFSPGYDAGSEMNDELCMNIPGPVCGGEGGSPGAGGEGYVHISNGIEGIGDLASDAYDWKNPTAKIEIKRVRSH